MDLVSVRAWLSGVGVTKAETSLMPYVFGMVVEPGGEHCVKVSETKAVKVWDQKLLVVEAFGANTGVFGDQYFLF